MTLVHASDGAKGLAALGADVFDAVLLDVMMPGIDGLTVCRRIRETSRVPIIMLTARGDEADRVVGLELGADDYVPKPFSPRELLARLRAVMRRAQPAAGGAEIVVGRVAIDVGRAAGARGRGAGRSDRARVRHSGRAGAPAGPRGPTRDAARGGGAPGRHGQRPDRRRPRLAPSRASWATIRRRRASSRRCGASATCCRSRRRATLAAPREARQTSLAAVPAGLLWRGPWGFWAGLDPAARERIVGEIRNAYGQRFGRRHPWDRVFHEAIGRRPGGTTASAGSCGCTTARTCTGGCSSGSGRRNLLAVVATAVAAHFGHGWLAAHPLRAVLLFGAPAVALWTATGRVARRIAQPLYELTRAAQEHGGRQPQGARVGGGVRVRRDGGALVRLQ